MTRFTAQDVADWVDHFGDDNCSDLHLTPHRGLLTVKYKETRAVPDVPALDAASIDDFATSLFLHERIETTTAKAKELRPYAERLITLARRGDIHSRRLAARKIQDRNALGKLFDDIAPRFTERPGGYTRILKLGNRKGDAADMSLIELVD